jgi:hypothetical protein
MIITSVLLMAALVIGMFAGVGIQQRRQARAYSARSRRAAKTRAEYVARRAAIERAHDAISSRLSTVPASSVADRGE